MEEMMMMPWRGGGVLLLNTKNNDIFRGCMRRRRLGLRRLCPNPNNNDQTYCVR